MNGATLRLAYDNGKQLDNISAFTKEAHQISDEAFVVKQHIVESIITCVCGLKTKRNILERV